MPERLGRSRAPVVGDEAPDFSLLDEQGALRTLRILVEAGPVVLYFYPAANSYGCTRECRHVRDLAPEFARLGALCVGVSPDGLKAQERFARANELGFPLLSDPDGDIARAYGVRRARGPLPVRRRTFVIDTDRRIRAVIASETRMAVHGDGALAALEQLAGSARPLS